MASLSEELPVSGTQPSSLRAARKKKVTLLESGVQGIVRFTSHQDNITLGQAKTTVQCDHSLILASVSGQYKQKMVDQISVGKSNESDPVL